MIKMFWNITQWHTEKNGKYYNKITVRKKGLKKMGAGKILYNNGEHSSKKYLNARKVQNKKGKSKQEYISI